MAVDLPITQADAAIDRLAYLLAPSLASIDHIVPVQKGGLYAAWKLSKILGKPLIHGLVASAGYDEATGKKVGKPQLISTPYLFKENAGGAGLLIVDDIIGSGETTQLIAQTYPYARIAVPFYWQSGHRKISLAAGKLTVADELPDGEYVNFPWEDRHAGNAEFLSSHPEFVQTSKLASCIADIRKVVARVAERY